MALLDWILLGIPVRSWVLAILVAALAFVVIRLAMKLLLRELHRLEEYTDHRLGRVSADALGAVRGWVVVIVSIWVGSHALAMQPQAHAALTTLTILAILLQIALSGQVAIRSYVARYTELKREEDAASVTTLRALGFLASVVLWAVIFLMGLSNLGIDVTALVAGLGVGGIAIALAVQNILADLFASLSIVLDKPFVYGDFIAVDDLMGAVENIGLKTTRLRSLSGEQLVFANSDLLKSRLRNYRRMFQRRVVLEIGVTYDTPRETLARIPTMIRDTIEALPDTRFDRSHFKGFGDSALQVETVYYVLVPDYNVYMDRQQAIDLEIMRLFEAEGIEFAFPTQTLLVTRSPDGSAAARGGERDSAGA